MKTKIGFLFLLLILINLFLAACGSTKINTNNNVPDPNEEIFKPSIWFTQSEIKLKEHLTINGHGFAPITRLKISGGINFPETAHGVVTTDIKGNFSVEMHLDLGLDNPTRSFDYIISVATRDNELKTQAVVHVLV